MTPEQLADIRATVAWAKRQGLISEKPWDGSPVSSVPPCAHNYVRHTWENEIASYGSTTECTRCGVIRHVTKSGRIYENPKLKLLS